MTDLRKAKVSKINRGWETTDEGCNRVGGGNCRILELLRELPGKAKNAYDKGLNESPSSGALAKVSLWSGLGSIVFGFPANVVSRVAAQGDAAHGRH